MVGLYPFYPAGTNPEIIHRLPRTLPSDKHVVIMDGGNDKRWSQSIMTTGARVQFLGTPHKPMTRADLEKELRGPNRGRHACIVMYDQVRIHFLLYCLYLVEEDRQHTF